MIDHFGLLAPFYEFFIPPKAPEKLLGLLSLPENGRVVDVGGGTGRIAQYLQGAHRQISVADPSKRMLLQSVKKDGIQPIGATAEGLPFSNNSFDRIVMVDALHHVANQQKTIAELWRILAPGGKLVIEEPDIRMLYVKLIALGEKLMLMRSHFFSAMQIATLFDSKKAQVRIIGEATIIWVVVDKLE